jgi:hypothetical protein
MAECLDVLWWWNKPIHCPILSDAAGLLMQYKKYIVMVMRS